jgi:hypothetical protein
MTERKIKFINADLQFNPSETIQSFYQICQYKDVNTNLYAIRKIKFNQNYDIIDVKVRYYPKKTVNIFIKKNKQNKLKIYPCNDISNIGLPTSAELGSAGSSLLNNSAKEYGFMEI